MNNNPHQKSKDFSRVVLKEKDFRRLLLKENMEIYLT